MNFIPVAWIKRDEDGEQQSLELFINLTKCKENASSIFQIQHRKTFYLEKIWPSNTATINNYLISMSLLNEIYCEVLLINNLLTKMCVTSGRPGSGYG